MLVRRSWPRTKGGRNRREKHLRLDIFPIVNIKKKKAEIRSIRTGQNEYISRNHIFTIELNFPVTAKEADTSRDRIEEFCCLRDRLQFLPKPDRLKLSPVPNTNNR